MDDTNTTADGPAARARGLTATDFGMLLVVLIWGANFAVVKSSLAEFPPLAFTALRFTLAALLLALIVYAREGSLAPPRGGFWKLAGLGFVGNTVYQLLFIVGLDLTTAGNTALLISTTPVLVALLGAALRIERVTRHVGAGVALAFAGIVFVLASRGVALSLDTLGGDLIILCASLLWALYTLGVRALGGGISSLRVTALTMLVGTPGILLAGLPQLARGEWLAASWAAWAGLAYSAVFALVVAYAIWNASVRAVGSSRTAVYSCLIPVVAALVSWPALGERPGRAQAFGAALIIAGILLTRRRAQGAGGAAEELHVSS
ncbi:MAG: DMT family transporter [Acidobacteria bacterium]|nr:DMT family transporter [Acidobacteriota bacterium]